MNFELGTREVR